MKKAELEPDVEYAIRSRTWSSIDVEASRVTMLRTEHGAFAVVRIVERAPGAPKEWRRGSKVTVSTRDITCRWSEWPAVIAAEAAKREAPWVS